MRQHRAGTGRRRLFAGRQRQRAAERSLDQLHEPLDGTVRRRCEQEMDVVGRGNGHVRIETTPDSDPAQVPDPQVPLCSVEQDRRPRSFPVVGAPVPHWFGHGAADGVLIAIDPSATP